MQSKDPIEKIRKILQKGMRLKKCRKCGCMEKTLETLHALLPSSHTTASTELLNKVQVWQKQMEPIKYSCLGCEYCYPADASNILNQAFPEALHFQLSCSDFDVKKETWPPVPGEYFDLCEGPACTAAVSTLASAYLAEMLAHHKPNGLCIAGKTETENIGIEKVIKNIITNHAIRFLILIGEDPKGHHSGRTFIALWEKGVDENMRVIDSPGIRSVLKNVTLDEIEIFRKQVEVIEMIGCEDIDVISKKVNELSSNVSSVCNCQTCDENTVGIQISSVPIIKAEGPGTISMDKAGYFVVIALPKKNIITVEHYSYDNKLQRAIEGKDARSIYSTIIKNGWIKQMSHAAYLGKELAKAELSMELGFKYVQDGA